jgi:MoxR-like ATPase
MGPAREASNEVVAAFERASDALGRARSALRGVIFGQDGAIELALATLVAGGHAMVVGGPGSAKTTLVQALGRALGLYAGRIQFTPDLDLSDLVGREDESRRENAWGGRRARVAGPVFRQLLLADDLDRAAPRVRTALLEAMHAGAVDVGAESHPLPRPFHLLATRGPTGDAGLNETEIDRFLLQIDMGPPDRGGERRMLIEDAGRDLSTVAAAMDAAALIEAQRVAVELPVGEKVVETILEVVRRARPDDPSAPPLVRAAVARGPGPRAGQALMRLARARALVEGRVSPSAADVKALALPVLKPRLTLHTEPARRADAEAVVAALTADL